MKHLQDMRSAHNLKTLRGERMGSMPKEGRSLFLDLYLQEKEKERLSQEIKILNKKILLNQKKLERTNEHISFLRNNINRLGEIENLNMSQKVAPLKVANSKNANKVRSKQKRR